MKETKQILISGEVDEDMLANVFNELKDAAEVGADVRAVISTFGGCVYCALGIYDLLRTYPGYVTTVGIGAVMSAGTILMQGGRLRLAGESAQFLVHYGAEISESHADAKQNKRLNAQMKALYLRHCKSLPPPVLTAWLREDKYLNSAEALKYGLIDGVARENKLS